MMVRPLPFSHWLSCWLMVLGIAATPLWAQEGATPPAAATTPSTRPATAPTADRQTLQRQFQALADRDSAVRQEARRRLMELQASDLPLLRQMVADARPLRPAQVAALHDVVMQVFLAGDPYPANPDQGFLGIGMGAPAFMANRDDAEEDDGSDGVVVLSRFPGFPGYRFLLDGDVILGVKSGGRVQRINASQGLSNAVAGRPSGATITLEVQRQGRLMEVSVTLAPMPQAAQPAPGAANRFESFQNERLQRAQAYWDVHFAPLMRQNML